MNRQICVEDCLNRWNCPFFAFFSPFFTPENHWNKPFFAVFALIGGLGASYGYAH